MFIFKFILRYSQYSTFLFILEIRGDPNCPLFLSFTAKISTVLCDKQDKVETLLTNCEKSLTPVLKTIIVMDPFDAVLTERASHCAVEILSLKDVEVISKSTFINMMPLFLYFH